MLQEIQIAPSLLSADFSKLAEEIQAVESAGADMIHIDVMDGHYVPNITIGPLVIKSLRKATKLPFDVHLMISPVDPFLRDFVEAGADIVTIHTDAGPHTHRSLQVIRSLGAKAGIALNPSNHHSAIEYLLDDLDQILIMTVNPGFGGQKFLETQLEKIQAVADMIAGRPIKLQVDGGINKTTAHKVIKAGANVIVAGAAVFTGNPADYRANIEGLR